MAAGVTQHLGLKLLLILNPGRQLANMDDRVGVGGDDDMGVLVGYYLCRRRCGGEHG